MSNDLRSISDDIEDVNLMLFLCIARISSGTHNSLYDCCSNGINTVNMSTAK